MNMNMNYPTTWVGSSRALAVSNLGAVHCYKSGHIPTRSLQLSSFYSISFHKALVGEYLVFELPVTPIDDPNSMQPTFVHLTPCIHAHSEHFIHTDHHSKHALLPETRCRCPRRICYNSGSGRPNYVRKSYTFLRGWVIMLTYAFLFFSRERQQNQARAELEDRSFLSTIFSLAAPLVGALPGLLNNINIRDTVT